MEFIGKKPAETNEVIYAVIKKQLGVPKGTAQTTSEKAEPDKQHDLLPPKKE